MCGIAGFFSPNKNYSKDELINMTSCLSHRGPDAEGYFQDDLVGLGHKRLSIIDLSEAANQPMHSQCNRYVIVYNGEVYNFNEIAKKLNVQLKTSSDTEVILEAFAKWGIEFVHELNGMFALAIYDKQDKNLFAFRDRIGIKPLYYYWDGKNFAFASELKSLLKLNQISGNKALNNSAVNAFLHLGYVPEPLCIYKNIKKLPAGHYAIIKEDDLTLQPYWKLDDNISSKTITDLHDAKSELKELITSSVKYRMISDVPYGTFLSGGTDSSLITAVAQQISNEPVKTFSIGFSDKEGSALSGKETRYNEAPYAKAVANHLGTDHHEFIVSYKETIPLVEEMIDVYDEPFADSSAIPTMLVSKLAKQYVTVTLSGDGGDELFFGYGAHKWAERLDNPLIWFARKPISLILSQMSSRYKRAAHLFQYDDENHMKSHIFSQEQYLFSRIELKELLTPEFQLYPDLQEEPLSTNRKLTASEKQAIFDIKYYLKDDLLTKVDRASMKYSLENRVPLLDHRIVNFALNISPELKMHGSIQKYLLKEVLYEFIPKKMFERPKQGFAIPLSHWLKNELNYLIEEFLNRDNIEKHGVVNYEKVNQIKKRFLSGESYLYNRLWVLICLHWWLSQSQK